MARPTRAKATAPIGAEGAGGDPGGEGAAGHHGQDGGRRAWPANEPIQTGTAPWSAARPAVVSIVLSPSSARKNAPATPRRPVAPGALVAVVVGVAAPPGPHREAEEQHAGAHGDGPVGDRPADAGRRR